MLALFILTGSAASAATISITGTVTDDGDGGTISGIPISTALGNQLYVYLIDNSNVVIDRSAVSGVSFTYSLTGQSNVNYSVSLSSGFYAINSNNPIIGLPTSSFMPTAEGATSAGDASPDYSVAINSSSNLIINFAVDARPTGFGYAMSSLTYDANGRVIIPSGAFTGNDPEDGTYNPGFLGRKIDLFQAAGGLLYYNGSLIPFSSAAAATRISNFDVSLLRFEIASNPTHQFAFSTVDNAGIPEFVPNSITLPGVALPISFSSFNGYAQGADNRLTWHTSTENGNAGFTIERSDDGSHFRNIATLASAAKDGNSTQPLSYEYLDRDVNATPHAPVYYRIRQTANDGAFNYSNVVRIVNAHTQDAALSLAPNPSTGTVSIDMATGTAAAANVSLTVVNATGSLVASRSFEVTGGRLSTALDLSTLPAGTYYMQLRGANIATQAKQLVLMPH